MKPHIKVIQRNGVDIYETSSMTMKCTKAEQVSNRAAYIAMNGYGIGTFGGIESEVQKIINCRLGNFS